MTSGILHFPCGQSVFTCATQVAPYQRLQILGTQGRIEIEIPFDAPPEQPCRMTGRMFLVEARRCYNLSLVISTRFKDSRRSIFEKHTPGYGVTGPGGGLCQEHGGNRGNFPLSYPPARLSQSCRKSCRALWAILGADSVFLV